MKTKVTIENGTTVIDLTPESIFEKDLVEKIFDNQDKLRITAGVDCPYRLGYIDGHYLKIVISEKSQS